MKDLSQNIERESEIRAVTLERLLSSADNSRVFGQPVTSGNYTVIPMAEVRSAGGFGSGMGFGPPSETTPEAGGGGGGGGGASRGRAVGAIVIGPGGVEIRPLLDITKISIAALVSMAAIAVVLAKSARRR